MPIYEYQGQQYEISETDPVAAKNKILSFLGKQEAPVQPSVPVTPEIPKETTLGQDFNIALTQAGNTMHKGLALGAGGALSAVGATDAADAIYRHMDEAVARSTKAANPENAHQSFGAKAGGMIATLPAQLLAMPFSPADTGTTMLNNGETLDKAITGSLLDTAGNVVGALPFGQAGNLLSRMVKGGAINAAQDTAVRTAIAKVAEQEKTKQELGPSLEAAGLSAILGAGLGAIPTGKTTKSVVETKPIVEQPKESSVSSIEHDLLKDVYKRKSAALVDLTEQHNALTRLIEDGNASEEIVKLYQDLDTQLKQTKDTVDKLDNILNNPEQTSASQKADAIAAREAAVRAKLDQLKVKNKEQATQRANEQYTSQDLQALQERANEALAKQDGLLSEPPPPPKSPAEVALGKIGEATNNIGLARRYLAELDQKKLDAQQAAELDVPGGKYNALYEALLAEEKAYTDIIAGRKPDLSWFENASKTDVEAPPVRQQTEVEGMPLNLADHAAMDALWRNETTAEPPAAGRARIENVPMADAIPEGFRETPTDTPVVQRDAVLSAAQQYYKDRYELNKLERILERVNSRITDYESGKSPSGTVDIASLNKQRESLETGIKIREERMASILKVNPELAERIKEKANQEFVKQQQKEVLEPTKYESMQELLDSNDPNLPNTLLNNPQLFDSVGKLHFDNNIPQVQRTIAKHFAEKLGLGKDQIFFVFDKALGSRANIEFFGNTAVIRLNNDAIKAKLDSVFKTEQGIIKTFGTKVAVVQQTYTNVRIIAHELGHMFMNKFLRDMSVVSGREKVPFNELPLVKILQEEFDSLHKKAFTVTTPFEVKTGKSIVERQKAFEEFFAEQVAKELLYKHTLGAFTNNKGQWLSKLQKLSELSVDYLRKQKINVDETNFFRSLVNELIVDNERSIFETGKTVFENFEVKKNDRLILSRNTYEDIGNLISEHTNWSLTSGAREMSDSLPAFSVKALTKLTSKMFGKNQIAMIFRDNPAIQNAYNIIREADKTASAASNRNWHGGDITPKEFLKKGFWTRYNKTKDGSSPYHQVSNTTDAEMARILQVFEKGQESGLSRKDALQTFGQHLTKNERQTYSVLDTMFDSQYHDVTYLQQHLNKKHILPYNPAWFPSERNGDWFITLSFNGDIAYRQHFDTKVAADAEIAKLRKENIKHLDISTAQRKSLDDIQDAQEQKAQQVEAVISMLKQKYPQASPQIIKDIHTLQKLMAERGGKLGMHHEERTNILGYKGSEVHYSEKERGRSFKEAIIKSVDSYSNGLRSMYLRTKLKPILEDPKLDPESKLAVQQMYDSALNRNRNLMDTPDLYAREGVEKVAKAMIESFGGEYKGKHATLDTIVNNTLEMLYLTKIMAKSSFILSQPMSSLQSIRHMSYDGGYIKPWVSYGKGLYKLMAGDKELNQAMWVTKEQSHTFEPQFIDSLHLTEKSGPIMSFVKDWVMLRKPAEFGDTMSRVMTYAAMFTHYRDMGHDFVDAVKLAEQGVDSTMITYGNRETSPLFSHAGMLGNQVRPLQTYPTAALGNLVADLKNMSVKEYKSAAPFLNYVLSTIALSGVMGLQFVAEYELIRKWMEDRNPGSGPPAITDIMRMDTGFEDRVIPEQGAWKQAMLLGIPSTGTGVDVSSSLRANEALLTTMVGVFTGHKAFYEMLPLAGLSIDLASGFSTLLKNKAVEKLGIEGQDLTVAQKNKALTQALPAGHIAYGAKEYLGVNETKIFGDSTGMKQGGKEGEATTERTLTDKVAGYMGTKSTEDRTNLLVNMRKQELDNRRKEQIKKNANLFVETGKPIYLDRLVDLQITDKQLENTIGNTMYKKLVDQRIRYLANKQGRINPEKAMRAMEYGDLPE